MASKPESTFIASVHKHLPPVEELYRVKMNNPYTAGMADVWYSGQNDLWVEYKFLVLPKRDSTVIDLCRGKNPALSDLQQEWLRSRYDEGRNVWVIVGCKEGGVVLQGRLWERPLTVREFRAWLEPRAAVAQTLRNFLTTPL